MVTKNEQFITQMKLRELREQRSTLLRTYDELQQRAEQAATQEEALPILYHGLREITFDGQRLHNDVSNLELLLRTAQRGESSPETLAFWRKNLEQELAQGRLRAEVVYIFGALLEEWTLHHANDTASASQTEQQHQQELISLLTQRPGEKPDQYYWRSDELWWPDGRAQRLGAGAEHGACRDSAWPHGFSRYAALCAQSRSQGFLPRPLSQSTAPDAHALWSTRKTASFLP